MAEKKPVITELKFAKIARKLAPNDDAPLNPSLDEVRRDRDTPHIAILSLTNRRTEEWCPAR